jgi:polyhydroxybutyrate depolymerase
MARSGAMVLLAAALAAGCAHRPAAKYPRAVTVEVDGRRRTGLLHVPASAHRPAPLLLAFHGGGGNAGSMERLSGLSALADREGFVVVYPDSIDGHWRDGREWGLSPVDDVAFVDSLVDAISRVHPVDEKRIFATGISNGGIFCHYLAARLSRRIAAIAPVVGGMADPFDRTFCPGGPVSVAVLMGTDDPIVPFAGGVVGTGRAAHGKVVGAEETARLWAAADGCVGGPSSGDLPDRDPGDGCRVARTEWAGCRAGSEVVLLTARGGGHTWPGGPQYVPGPLVGRVCRDVDFAYLWRFLAAHPKP